MNNESRMSQKHLEIFYANSLFSIPNSKIMKKIYLPNINTTKTLAGQIARDLKGGEVLAFSGPLGSGKTTFVQFLAKALGVKQAVRSPSFIVLQIFKLQATSYKLQATILCHIDCYRLKDTKELNTLGLHDYLGKPNVITVIEWAEKIKSILPRKTTWLKFQYTKGGRSVTFFSRFAA